MKIDLDTPAFNILIISFLMVMFFVLPILFHDHCEDGDVKREVSKVQINSFLDVCKVYYTITGKAPSRLEDFVKPPANTHPWKQLLEEIPKDPWGNEYLYSIKGNIATIHSAGPTDSTSDDIKVIFDFSVLQNERTGTGGAIKIVEDEFFLNIPLK